MIYTVVGKDACGIAKNRAGLKPLMSNFTNEYFRIDRHETVESAYQHLPHQAGVHDYAHKYRGKNHVVWVGKLKPKDYVPITFYDPDTGQYLGFADLDKEQRLDVMKIGC